jgi:hypothetical protein
MRKIPSNLQPCVKAEVEALLNSGNCRLATIREIEHELAAIGYRLDRTMDCRSIARTLTGVNTGNSYPAITSCVREVDTGLSFANVDARRDSNYQELRKLRLGGMFAIVNGAIFDF